MSQVLGRPLRIPRSHPVKPRAQAPGMRKGTTASRKPTGARRATGPHEARRTTRGYEARQRGTPPANTKAHGQVPSNNGRRVPQIRTARKTRNEPGQENRCQATPAAVRTDVCAPGSEPSPCRLRKSRHADGRVRAWRVPSPCRERNSRRPHGRVRTRRVPSPCRLQKSTVRMDECVPRTEAPHTQHHTHNTRHNTPSEHSVEQEPSGPGKCARNTGHRAGTPVNRSQVAQDTAHAAQSTERAQWLTGANWPRTPHTQQNAPGGHTGEQEPTGLGHRTRSTKHRASTPVNKRQVTQDTAHARQRTERAIW